VSALVVHMQAQGLLGIFGEEVKEALLQHNVLLAAHGPYTAEGVTEVTTRCWKS